MSAYCILTTILGLIAVAAVWLIINEARWYLYVMSTRNRKTK